MVSPVPIPVQRKSCLFRPVQPAAPRQEYAPLLRRPNEPAYLGAARCLYKQAEYVRCIQLGTSFITQFPKSLKLAEILMFLGMCYQGMERPDKALPFYDKALTMAGPLLVPKIKELLAACEGAIHA